MPPISALIPPVDPAPLPAPVWILQALLIGTFAIHLVFMNLTLGSSVLAALAHLGALGGSSDHRRRLASELMHQLPWHIAFTVTTGIAPLLFVQVLYGPLFYSATIAVGWVWISLVLVVIVAYYAAYLYKLGPGRGSDGTGAPAWALTAGALFLVAAAIQVAVNTLQIEPDRWLAVYQGAASGFGSASWVPRFLHFTISAVAFTGLYTALRIGSGRPTDGVETSYRDWAGRLGVRVAYWPTLAQVGVGLWLLLTLPPSARSGLIGDAPVESFLFILGVMLAVALMSVLGRLRDPGSQPRLLRVGAGLMLVTMLGMVLIRDGARRLALAGSYSIWELPVRSQSMPILLFLLLFAGGLYVLWKVLWRVRTELRGELDAPGGDA